MKKEVEMKFNACIENVTFARNAIAGFVLSQDLTLNVINEIKTIVSEAVTNAIVHGYKEDDSKLVTLIIVLDNKLLSITVKDDGVGIENVEKAREPLFSTKLDNERAGLGFTIMEIFSDTLEITSEKGKGTTVFATKLLS